MVHASSQPGGRRQRRRTERTHALLEAAQHVLVEQGEAGLTMQAVADQADVAVGGIYRYFPGKQALIAALQVRAVERFAQVLGRMLGESTDPIAGIYAAGRAWFAFADAHPAEFELLDRSLSDPNHNLDDDGARAVDTALSPVLAQVTAKLAEAAERGALSPGDAALRTHVLWALVHGAAHFRKRDRLGGATAAEVLRSGTEGLLAGWS